MSKRKMYRRSEIENMNELEIAGLTRESSDEYKYMKYLLTLTDDFLFQPTAISINLGKRKTYTPDFIVFDGSIARIIEIKGWHRGIDPIGLNYFKKNIREMIEFDYETFELWIKHLAPGKEFDSIEYEMLKWARNKKEFIDYHRKDTKVSLTNAKAKYKELEAEHKVAKKRIRKLNSIINQMNKDIIKYIDYANKEILTTAQERAMNNLEDKLRGNSYGKGIEKAN